MTDFAGLMPPMLVDQAERNLLSFIAAHSDSMPIAIDQDRVIRYCDPRLREILGYGWQEEIVNGATLIDKLLPPDPQLQAWHVQMISRWFAAPRPLAMHDRGPLPIMTKRGDVYSALVKLVGYEPLEQGRRPLLDQPKYYRFAMAFVTILPRSWEPRHYAEPEQPANVPLGRPAIQSAEPSAGGRPPLSANHKT